MEKRIEIDRIGPIFLLNIAIKGVVDWILNPILMIEFHYTVSLITTTLIYVIIGIISVKLYDNKQEDLFGIEIYKQNKKPINRSILGYTANFFKIFILGLVLSLKNTGLVVIVFRDGHYLYNGFTGNFIKIIFLVYALIINASWNILMYFLSPFWIEVGKILKMIFNIIIMNQMASF